MNNLVLAGLALSLFAVSATAQTSLDNFRDDRGSTPSGSSFTFRNTEEPTGLRDLQQTLTEIRDTLRREQERTTDKRVEEELRAQERKINAAVEDCIKLLSASVTPKASTASRDSDDPDPATAAMLKRDREFGKFLQAKCAERDAECRRIAKKYPSLADARKDPLFQKLAQESELIFGLQKEWQAKAAAEFGIAPLKK